MSIWDYKLVKVLLIALGKVQLRIQMILLIAQATNPQKQWVDKYTYMLFKNSNFGKLVMQQ